MRNRPCPRCRKDGRFLDASSANALVDYYRCDYCGTVWALDQDDPTKPPRHVTPPKTDAEGRD